MRDDWYQREGLEAIDSHYPRTLYEPYLERLSRLDAFRLKRYQGALVQLWNRGVFRAKGDKKIVHVDVHGMYPSVMILLNISSENVTLLERKPYSGILEFDHDNGIIEIPDSYCGNLRMQVGQDDSVTRKFMIKFRGIREVFKKEGGELAESNQRGIKLIQNMTYGYHGLEFSRYGSFLVAIATAGTGRFCMDNIIKLLKQRSDITLIECDTDGVYEYGVDLSGEINDMLHALFEKYKYKNMLGVGANFYKGMISYSMKNYVLQTFDDKIKFKGSAFHGRSMPRLCRTALDRFAHAIFDKEPLDNVWREFRDLRSLPLRQFTMSVQLGKLPEDYDANTMYKQLSDRLEEPIWGQDIYYVKTVNGYVPLGTMSDEKIRRELDTKYYMGRMRSVVSRLTDASKRKKVVQVRKGGKKLITTDLTLLRNWF